MVRIRFCIFALISLFCLENLYSFSNQNSKDDITSDCVLHSFEKEIYEPDNIDVEKLILGEKDNSTEEQYIYLQTSTKNIKNYLSNECASEFDFGYLKGNWELYTVSGEKANASSYYFSNKFSISEEVYKGKSNLIFRNGPFTSKLYKGKDNQVYIFIRGVSFLKQIKILDEKLYFYILDGNEWKLDSIHEEGKNAFILK